MFTDSLVFPSELPNSNDKCTEKQSSNNIVTSSHSIDISSSSITNTSTIISSNNGNLTTNGNGGPIVNGDADNVPTNSEGVIVMGEEYVIVGVCVVVVRLVVEYAECAVTLRLAAHQLLTRLTELLRRFNSDTCRLLIEAGAVALGLKTITTRNLALAWRSLQLLLTLLPRLNAHFSTLLKPSLVHKHVDQLTREYHEHCDAIQRKIVGVMSDTLDKQLETWEARSPVPSPCFNGILRATSKLHEAVSGVLSINQMKMLFDKVTSTLKDKLKYHLIRLNVSSIGPQSW